MKMKMKRSSLATRLAALLCSAQPLLISDVPSARFRGVAKKTTKIIRNQIKKASHQTMASSVSSYTTGILAELFAPLLMTLGFIIWDKQWVGSAFALNLYKCTTASIGFALASLITRRFIMDDSLFPSDVFTVQNVGYLILSSTLGILIGDWAWLEALRRIGARRVIVVDTIKPFIAALFGWFMLGERLKPLAWLGMAVTVLGVLVVSLESERDVDHEQDDNKEDKEKDSATPIENSMEHVVVEPNDESKVDKLSDSNNAFQLSGTSASTAGTEDLGRSFRFAKGIEDETSNENCDDSIGKSDRSGASTMNSKTTSTCEQPLKSSGHQRRSTPIDLRIGYTLSIFNAFLDTYGSFLTKNYGSGMTSWEINLIRFGFSGVCMVFLSLMLISFDFLAISYKIRKEKPKEDLEEHMKNEEVTEAGIEPGSQTEQSKISEASSWYRLPHMSKKRWVLVSLGVVFVTFLCPALSNYALFRIALGLALTLGSTGPLYALPLTWWIKKETPTYAGCIGAVVAFAGIVLLSLSGELP